MGPFILQLIFHIFVAYGLWLMMEPLFNVQDIEKRRDYRKSIKNRVVTKQQKNNSDKRKSKFILIRHLEDLLYLTRKNYQPGVSVGIFFIGTLFLMIAVFLIALLTLKDMPMHLTFTNSLLPTDSAMDTKQPVQAIWRVAALLSTISGILPYLFLRYQYTQRRNKASYDLLEVVLIYTKYGYFNVSGALNKTAILLSENNVLKRPLFVLAEVFANYTDEYELNEAVQRFTSTIGTTFADIFVSNLIYAERESNHQLSGALLDLTQMMEQQREIIIQVKTDNRDSIQLGLFGNILVIILSIGTFIYLLTWGVYYKLQFQTTMGLGFLSFIVVTLFLSLVIGVILSKPKLDYK